MSQAYASELSFRSIQILTTGNEELRLRMPRAWDHGQSNLGLTEILKSSPEIRTIHRELQEFFSQKQPHGDSWAKESCARIHETTLERMARKMVHLDALISTQQTKLVQKEQHK